MSISMESSPTTTLISPQEFAPTSRRERLANVDFVRGIALLGILLVNAILFFGPLAALMEPSYHARLSRADHTVMLLIQSLCMSKFISIFSMLFGYGLLGQIEKAAARGRSPGWFTLRRLLVLALFGMLHGLFLWYGDVLFIYACIGGWLLLARNVSARGLAFTAGVVLSIALMLRIGFELLTAWAGLLTPPPPPPVPEGMSASLTAMFQSSFNPASPIWIEAEQIAYRDGPWRDAQLFRTVSWLSMVVTMALTFGWLSLGMFFVGAVLWRVQFFAPEQEALRWRTLKIFLPLGILLEGFAGWFFWFHPPTDRWAWAFGHIVQQIGLTFLPLGYLTVLALLADRLPGWLRMPVCSAGRMSLTVYLLETILATALAYHWGFRLFGAIPYAWLPVVALSIWVGLVILSHLWLRVFEYGPMEWLWRRLEYGPIQATHSSSTDVLRP